MSLSFLQIYRNNDKPLYRTGNKVLIALSVFSLALFIAAKFYYDQENECVFLSDPVTPSNHTNRARARKWNAMSTEERDEYLANNKATGNKR
jgi:hypothetical protein